MFISFLIFTISFTSLHCMDNTTQIKDDWNLYKQLRLKSTEELEKYRQSHDINKAIDLAEYARDGHLMAKLIHICMPQELVREHIAPHLIQSISTKYKHALLNNKSFESKLKIEQITHDNWQKFSRHDGTYSMVPNIDHTYDMWSDHNHRIPKQKGCFISINQQKYTTERKLTSSRNNITNKLYAEENNGDLILSHTKDNHTNNMMITPFSPTTHYCFSNDNTLLALGHQETNGIGALSIINIETGKEEKCCKLNGSVSTLCSAHHSPIFVVGSNKPWVFAIASNGLFTALEKDKLCFIGEDAPCTHAEFSQDDRRLLICFYNELENKSFLKLFDTSNSNNVKHITTITQDEHPYYKAFFICNGEKILYLQKDGNFTLRNGLTGKNTKGTKIMFHKSIPNNHDPIIIWSNKHKLIICVIYNTIELYSSENHEYFGSLYTHNQCSISGIGITNDENSIVFTDSDNDSYQSTLYNHEDIENITFLEQQATIIQIYEMLTIHKRYKEPYKIITAREIKEMNKYIQEQQTKKLVTK